MISGQPHFRFNPGAYETGRSFEKSAEICDVCQSSCGWKYTGSIYALQRPTVCADCIANGNLTQFMDDRHFSLHDIELSGASSELETEVLQRTPGVACFYPFDWPVLDSKPMQFIGYGEDQRVLSNPDAQLAIEEAFVKADGEYELQTPTSYALVFKEISGDRYRAVIDLD